MTIHKVEATCQECRVCLLGLASEQEIEITFITCPKDPRHHVIFREWEEDYTGM